MPVVVLLELTEPADAPLMLIAGEPPEPSEVHLVHAAPPDPEVPRDPGLVTVCGRDTALMLSDPWQPAGPGGRWWPPRWAGRICPTCDHGVRPG